jgi:hypothetical protein
MSTARDKKAQQLRSDLRVDDARDRCLVVNPAGRDGNTTSFWHFLWSALL